jgi:sedoheptulokinase
MSSGQTSLGIDCGTGKVAVAVVDAAGAQLHTGSRPHAADLSTPAGRHEQDAERIIATAAALVREIPADLRARIRGIGFTGQMHGVVLHDATTKSLSPLVTWQDQRAAEDPAFLSSLGRPLNTGFGMATLAWWGRRGELPSSARAATIHGLLAARWSALDRAPIDPTDAAAWGGLAQLPDVPAQVLPALVGHGAMIGLLTPVAASDLGLTAGIPLHAPLGDNQASVRATLSDPAHDLGFTLGTGCQLAAIVPRMSAVELGHAERRPFDAAHDLIVAAPLCGGAAWKWLAETAVSWIGDFVQPAPTLEVVYAHLDKLGMAADDALTFAPHLLGERHAGFLTGSLSGLRLSNGSLGQIARAVAHGIVANAKNLFPPAVLGGRTRVVASGNALRRSTLLRQQAASVLGLPLVDALVVEEAATGAALVAIDASAPQRRFDRS